MQRAYEGNANGYVVKPLDFEKFKQLMEELGYFWLSWNQAPNESRQTKVRGYALSGAACARTRHRGVSSWLNPRTFNGGLRPR